MDARTDAKHALGEPRVLVSRAALLHNARLIRRAVAPRTRVCAIIKADAYGHGAGIVADALCHFSDRTSAADGPAVDAVAVASIDEADALPELGVPVIVFRPVENTFVGRQRLKLEHAIRNGWVLTVCSPAAAEDVARVALACGKRAAVQVMVDTGMTRSGVCADSLDELLCRVGSRASLRLVGLCTHFSNAEAPDDSFTREQLARFRRCTDAVARRDDANLVRHAANSAATFFAPESHLDMVRPGIALYGIDPTGRPCVDRALRPALRWAAPLVGVKAVKKGTGVGYGQTWRADRDTRIGLVPVGYADGYPRCYSNRAVVMVHGRPARVVGRISMDLTTVDLGDVPHAAVGDEVTLLDPDPLSPASVYALAGWADTITYEVLCRIGPRVKRVAIDPEESDDARPLLSGKGRA
jgi:alanine racemase